MAKKDFKKGLNNLIEENIDDINEMFSTKKEEPEIDKKIAEQIDIENVTDDKLKWMLIKISRLEKELNLWRTGRLTLENFKESLKKSGLRYDKNNNEYKIRRKK